MPLVACTNKTIIEPNKAIVVEDTTYQPTETAEETKNPVQEFYEQETQEYIEDNCQENEEPYQEDDIISNYIGTFYITGYDICKYCSDEEVIKYIYILQGEYDDDDFISSMITKFEMLRESNVLNKKYDKVFKCLEEKDCKSDVYTAINAYLEEWDDIQDRSIELNDPNRQAG